MCESDSPQGGRVQRLSWKDQSAVCPLNSATSFAVSFDPFAPNVVVGCDRRDLVLRAGIAERGGIEFGGGANNLDADTQHLVNLRYLAATK